MLDLFEKTPIQNPVPLKMRIREMSVGHKIKLAFTGNKECRSILIRDTNKVVSVAVIKSGKLTEREVSIFAANRYLSKDVIRELSLNRKFTRKYIVKYALITNPKTPTHTAMALLKCLKPKDIQKVSNNRNIPRAVRMAANKLTKEMRFC